MRQMQSQAADEDARQIFRITRIECELPLPRVESLILGDAPCAQPLADVLRQAGASVTCQGVPPSTEEQYDLILLLQGLEAEALGALARPGALVIDACRQKNSEWVIYDPSLHYRRIRVISMAGL